MKITNNYPIKLQDPFPRYRANINGKLFFKYRQKFRNKTRHEEGIRRILSYPAPNLFKGRIPHRFTSGPVVRMERMFKKENHENNTSYI